MKDRLTWLPNSILKGIKLPSIVYENYSGQDYGGYYIQGTEELVIVYDIEEYIPATIAHEMCHYLQYIQGRSNNIQRPKWNTLGNTYETQIKNYFSLFWEENEALHFEYKYASNDLNDWWLNKLVKE